MRFKNPYMNAKQKIELLERWIMFHSYLYYELNENVVSDKVYDDNANQLMELKNEFKKEYKESRYYDLFFDYDGSTGMHLIDRIKEDNELNDKLLYDILIMKNFSNK